MKMNMIKIKLYLIKQKDLLHHAIPGVPTLHQGHHTPHQSHQEDQKVPDQEVQSHPTNLPNHPTNPPSPPGILQKAATNLHTRIQAATQTLIPPDDMFISIKFYQ